MFFSLSIRYEGLYCEVQIRSLLQHAWAEIEHDRNYKFSGILPKELRTSGLRGALTKAVVFNKCHTCPDYGRFGNPNRSNKPVSNDVGNRIKKVFLHLDYP